MDSMKDMRAMLVLWKDKFTVWLSYTCKLSSR